MRRLSSGAVALARATSALALKEEAIATTLTGKSPGASPSIAFAARPHCFFSSSSSSAAAAAWRLHQQRPLWAQEQQEKTFFSCSRAASNSAASSREEAEEEKQGVDDSSKTKRHAESISSASVSASSATSPVPAAVSYVAPLSTTVHRLKRLSLFSCLLTTAAAPTLAATEAMPPAARAAAAAGVAGFGLFTTGLLHWFVGPYVHELTWRKGGEDGAADEDDAIELTTLDFFGARRRQRLPLSRVAAPPEGSVHPQATFSDSATGKLYYIDVDNFVSVSAASGGGGGGAERERAAAALLKRLVAAEGEEEAGKAL